jgi:hypothetical protein
MRFSLSIIGFLAATTGFAAASDDTAEKYFPQKLTAQQLLYYCASSALSSSGRNRQNYCSGFVSGVEESVRLLDTDGHAGNKKFICTPEGKLASDFREVYIRYASRKGTDLSRPAALVVLEALEAAYPCGE